MYSKLTCPAFCIEACKARQNSLNQTRTPELWAGLQHHNMNELCLLSYHLCSVMGPPNKFRLKPPWVAS